jgi:hypothetical protein
LELKGFQSQIEKELVIVSAADLHIIIIILIDFSFFRTAFQNNNTYIYRISYN